MNNSQRQTNELESAAIGALAATTKTPFKTAFMITLGIGAARALLFFSVLAGLVLLYKWA